MEPVILLAILAVLIAVLASLRYCLHRREWSLAGPDDAKRITALNLQTEDFLTRGLVSWALTSATDTYQRAEKALDIDSPATLASRELLGACLHAVGHSAEALAHHEAVLQQRCRTGGDPDPYVWTSENNVAVCLLDLDRTDEAMPRLESAERKMWQMVRVADIRSITVELNLADCLSRQGKTDRALKVIDTALEKLDPYGEVVPPPGYAAYYENYRELQKNAEKDLHKALRKAWNSKTGDAGTALAKFEGPQLVISSVENQQVVGPLAIVEESAYSSMSPAFGRSESWTDRKMVTLMRGKALCLMRAGRPTEALPLYRHVLYHSERLSGGVTPATPSCRRQFSECLMALGKWDEALRYLDAALVEQRASVGDDHPGRLQIGVDRARVLEKLGRYEEAATEWQQLGEVLCSHMQPGGAWLNVLQESCKAMLFHVSEGRLPDWPSLFQGLCASSREAMDLLDTEQWRVARLAIGDVHSTYLRLCLNKDRVDLLPAALAGVQGRKLAALVRDELELKAQKEGAASLAGQYRAARLELRRLAIGLDSSQFAQFEEIRIQQLEYRRKLNEFRALRERCVIEYPQILKIGQGFSPTLQQLQSRLAESDALVLLLSQPGAHESMVVSAAVIRAQSAVTVSLDRWGRRVVWGGDSATDARQIPNAASQRLIARRLFELPQARAVTEPRKGDDKQPEWDKASGEPWGKWLARRLWQPLADHLAAVDVVHLVPQGELHGLPYDAGCPASTRLASYPGLVHFDQLMRQDPGSARGVEGLVACRAYGAEETDFPIHLACAEPAILKALWSAQGVTDALVADYTGVCCLHVAGHGNFDPRHPAMAGVALGPEEMLGFHEVLTLPRLPPLVFLSACVVGQTREDSIEGEPLGLVSAMLLRGARFVVGATEPVEDALMPIMVALFYQAWRRSGDSPAMALAEAKRRAVSGEWYPETESILRAAYAPVLDEWGEQVARDGEVLSLARLAYDWNRLSMRLREQIGKHYDNRDALLQIATSEAAMAELGTIRSGLTDGKMRGAWAAAHIENLLSERHERARIEELVSSMQGFGWGEPPRAHNDRTTGGGTTAPM
jgi:tetratricopeptide (TPR) repeat protein